MIVAHPKISWRLARTFPHFQIPNYLRTWLLDPCSTSSKMQVISQGTMSVRVVTQKWETIQIEEQHLLGMKQREFALVREVEIYCNGQAWMLARCIFPRQTVSGKTKFLRYQLNERPLGEILYSEKTLQRSEFELAKVSANQQQYPFFNCFLQCYSETLWARRSIFLFQNKPLLLTEVFLPAMVEYCKKS